MIQAPPQRQQEQRDPLGLRNVRVVRRVCEMERRECEHMAAIAARRGPELEWRASRYVATADSGNVRRTSQLYAATDPTRARAVPGTSVSGWRYAPMREGGPNCSMTVNGSWWRPTIS